MRADRVVPPASLGTSRPAKSHSRNPFRITTIQISIKTNHLKSFVLIDFRKNPGGVGHYVKQPWWHGEREGDPYRTTRSSFTPSRGKRTSSATRSPALR